MQRKYFTNNGGCYGLVSKAVNKGVPEMVAFAWFDHDMHFFIVTRRYIEEVQDVSRQRWRQVVADVNADN